MTITLRSTKGAPLTIAEADGNFSDLDARTAEAWAMEGVEPAVREGDPSAPQLNLLRGNVRAYEYFAGEASESWANFDVPFNWAPGTDIYAAVHWTPGPSTNTGNARFGLEFTYAAVNGTFPATQTFYIAGPADGTAYKHYQALSAPFSGALVQPNMRFLIRVFRDGTNVADTFPDGLFIVGVDFYYRVNKFGVASITPPY